MNKEIEDLEVKMESRLMYLEDSLQQMSLQMMKKDSQIELLQDKILFLEEKIKDIDERKMNRNSEDPGEERPPHY